MTESTDTKTVRVSRSTWLALHEQKHPDQTMDEVIADAIDSSELEQAAEQ